MEAIIILLQALAVSQNTSEPIVREDMANCWPLYQPPHPERRLNVFSTTYFDSFFSVCESMLVAFDNATNGELYVHPVTDDTLVGMTFAKNLNEERYSMFQAMLAAKSNAVEVLYLDTQWVNPLMEHLAPLEKRLADDFYPKWVTRNANDDIVAIATRGSSQTMFYRRDLFDLHNLGDFPTTWDEFTTKFTILRDKERARRNNSNWFPFAMASDDGSANQLTYGFISLLSGHHGGGIVEPDGTITVNNKNASEALGRWKSYIGTLMPPMVRTSGSGPIAEMFRDDGLAVVTLWTGSADEFNGLPASWDVRAAAIPGGGYGCSGYWSVALSKYTDPSVEKEARAYIDMYLNNTVLVDNIVSARGLPVLRQIWDDPGLQSQYCHHNKILCQGIKDYPEFYSGLSHRPSEGCGSMYPSCQDAIYRTINRYFESPYLTAEMAVAELADELSSIMAISSSQLSGGDTDTMTDHPESIAILVITGLMVIAVGVYLWYRLSKIRPGRGCKLPLLLVFGGGMIAVLLAYYLSVVSQMDSRTRDLSDDLAVTSRLQHLQLVEDIIEATYDSLRGRSLTSTAVMLRAVAKVRVDVGRLHFERDSLLVVMDPETLLTYVSSNQNLQQVSVTATHPWLLYAHRTSNTSTGLSASVNGTSVFITQKLLSVGGGEFTTISFLVVYCTPKVVVMKEADDSRESARHLSIIITCLGVWFSVALTLVLMGPIIGLSAELEKVRLLDLDYLSAGSSIITETAALLSSFSSMCNTVAQCKVFLPDVIIESADKLEYVPPPAVGRAHPSREVAIVFTDVESSTSLWESLQRIMRTSLAIHNQVVRSKIQESETGYEVKTVGDSFMIVFQNAVESVKFALAVQESLFAVDTWPKDLLSHPCSSQNQQEGWNGLRIKIGIHFGSVDKEKNPTTGRAEYYGPTVNLAARIQQGTPGGAIGLSDQTYQIVTENPDSYCLHFYVPECVAYIRDTDCSFPLLLPTALRQREHVISDSLSVRNYDDDDVQSISSQHDYDELRRSRSRDLRPPLQERLAKTVASCGNVMIEGISMHELRKVLSCVETCASRTNGQILSVRDTSIVLTWATAKVDFDHLHNSIRFVGHFKKSISDPRSAHIGICSGNVMCGNFGKIQRFNMVIGMAVDTAHLAAIGAMKLGVLSLVTTTIGGVMLHNLHDFRTQHPTLLRLVDFWDVELPAKYHNIPVYQIRSSAVLSNTAASLEETPLWSSAFNEWYLEKTEEQSLPGADLDPVVHHITSMKKSKTHLINIVPAGYEPSLYQTSTLP
eukprot:TRINITY_DN693_c0_g1_i1.p1 TRINITY_DN693_c0_g1~~TRINITY_DN693_c0_g1_i1.p1  ORF type:complete len:1279 (+),score=208.24 TRINITY_DN693_c0_g1_i1:83-3919(+)